MDSSADPSDPPTGSKPEEPETSQMAAVPPDPEVVWPEDPFEVDGHAAEAAPDAAAPTVPDPADPPWTQQGFGKPAARPAHTPTAPPAHEAHGDPFPTQPAMPAWPPKSQSEPSVGKTKPPTPRADADEVMKTAPPAGAGDETKDTKPPAPAADEAEDTRPPVAASDEELKTAPPLPAMATVPPAVTSNQEETREAVDEALPEVPEADEEAPAAAIAEEPAPDLIPFEAEPRAQDPDSEPDLPVIAPLVTDPTAAAAEPVSTPEPPALETAPEALIPPEPQPGPEPEPAQAPAAAQPAAAAAATPGGPEPLPWPNAPKPANPAIPTWAPRLHTGASPSWPASGNTPAWAPQTTGNLHTAPPASQQPAPPAAAAASAPTPPAAAAAQAPVPAAHAPAPASATPAAPAADAKTKPSWEIVAQEVEAAPAFTGPSPEDKSYAEWFAWAKRSGAPASACHAAAQGAFRALSTGQDMNVAVQWATLAMASPPGLVGASRQIYCAWFSLGNIDLKLPTQQAHAFATGAIQALESGADSMVAHQMGLAAAGITAR